MEPTQSQITYPRVFGRKGAEPVDCGASSRFGNPYQSRSGIRLGSTLAMGVEELIGGWSFTEIGGGQGTKDGEWLDVEQVPTTVHVELLKAGRIPDPVSHFLR